MSFRAVICQIDWFISGPSVCSAKGPDPLVGSVSDEGAVASATAASVSRPKDPGAAGSVAG
jgi:hypothetical protein